jgi:hypothetical protein
MPGSTGFPFRAILNPIRETAMRVEIQLRIVGDDDTVLSDDAVLRLERADHRLAVVGLSLAEAKTLLADVQNRLVAAQASDYVARHRPCPACGRRRPIKGYETIAFRTAFGVVRLPSPRLVHCRCQAAEAKTFSPLTTLLTEHTAPELLYLESKWSSLVSYGLTADLLREVLPVGTTANASTIRNHLHKVARRCDADLGAEQAGFIDGCPADWKDLPIPEGPIVVGLDGGHVRNWADKKTSFEVVVGKSVPEDREHRYFGCVPTVDDRPKRRIFEVLRGQGLRMNQDLVLLTAYFHRFRPVVFIETGHPCSRKPASRFHDFGHPFSPRTAPVKGELGV